MKFKTKSAIVEAFEYRKEAPKPTWLLELPLLEIEIDGDGMRLAIGLIGGEVHAYEGCYIVKDGDGKISVYSPSEFEKIYEPIEKDQENNVAGINLKLAEKIKDRIREYDHDAHSNAVKTYRRYESIRCLMSLISSNRIRGTIRTNEQYDEAIEILDDILPPKPSLVITLDAAPGSLQLQAQDCGPYIARAEAILEKYMEQPLVLEPASVSKIHQECFEIVEDARVNGVKCDIFPVYFRAGGMDYRITESGDCERRFDGGDIWRSIF